MKKLFVSLLMGLFSISFNVAAIAADSAEVKAAKVEAKRTYKAAEAECKKMKRGPEKTACKKDAEAKEKQAKADIKAMKKKM